MLVAGLVLGVSLVDITSEDVVVTCQAVPISLVSLTNSCQFLSRVGLPASSAT